MMRRPRKPLSCKHCSTWAFFGDYSASPGGRTVARLLLIDDDPALIPKQVRLAFPAPEHTVEVARSGAAGLDRIRASAPDVVLLDMRLPDQSGLEVFRAIRLIDARIPVIFVTLAKTADAAIEAMQHG